jgi:hypothetical protein
MSAPYFASSNGEGLHKAPASSTISSVRESLVCVRNDFTNHRVEYNAFQKNLDASLEDITSKLNRMKSMVDDQEGSNPTNDLAGDHSSRFTSLFDALRKDLGTLREASRANKIRADASQTKLESSLRDHEMTLEKAGTRRGEQMTTEPAVSKVPAPVFTVWTSVATLSAAPRALAVEYVEASGLSCHPYFIHSPLTLLEFAYLQNMKSSDNVMEQMCMERELGMSFAECAQQVAFRRIIPIAFGTGEEWYKLSAIPTPKDFVSNSFPDPSLSYRLRSALSATRRSEEGLIRSSRLSDSVKGLLMEMMELSHRFIESLLSFMWDHHRRCVQATAFSEEDSWDLVQRLTWEVLMELSACYTCAFLYESDRNTPQSTGEILWGTLQMHRVMETYTKQSHWENHPSLSPLITQFLLPRVAMRHQVDQLSREVEVLRETVASLQGPNPATSHSNSTRNARRRQRRRGGRIEAEDAGATHVSDDVDSLSVQDG